MSYFYRQVVAKSPVKAEPSPAYENGWNAINQLIRQDYSWAGREPNVFFARRAGRYYDFSGVSGLDCAEDSRAFAFTDIDGDGNLDMVLKSRLAPQVRVFQNAVRRWPQQDRAGAARNEVESRCHRRACRSGRAGEVAGRRLGLSLAAHQAPAFRSWTIARAPKRFASCGPPASVQELPPLDAGFLYEVTEGETEYRSTPLKPPKQLFARMSPSRPTTTPAS